MWGKERQIEINKVQSFLPASLGADNNDDSPSEDLKIVNETFGFHNITFPQL